MVGHTHEDVDQVFSRVSTYLKRNSVYTVKGNGTDKFGQHVLIPNHVNRPTGGSLQQ